MQFNNTHTHTHTQPDSHTMRRTRAHGREARDTIGETRGEAKKRKKPQKSYKRDVENGGDLGARRKKRRQKSIGSVDFDPEHLEKIKELGREAQGAQSLSKNCRERVVCPLSCLIRGFCSRYR